LQSVIHPPLFSPQFSKFLPEVCSKFTACYGIATILDPFLLFIVDVAYHNYDCGTYDAPCSTDYTSNDCSCFEGDFVKLFNRTKADEGSGITGAILIVVVYFGTVIISSFLYYAYLVYVHKDARILDLWRRIKGISLLYFGCVVCEISLPTCLSACLSVYLNVCLYLPGYLPIVMLLRRSMFYLYVSLSVCVRINVYLSSLHLSLDSPAPPYTSLTATLPLLSPSSLSFFSLLLLSPLPSSHLTLPLLSPSSLSPSLVSSHPPSSLSFFFLPFPRLISPSLFSQAALTSSSYLMTARSLTTSCTVCAPMPLRGRVCKVCDPYPILSCSVVHLGCPSRHPALPFPALSCPVLSCPVLSYPVLSCPVLSCPVLSCPVLSCPILSYPVLSCPVLSCPVLSCPILSYPVLSCPILSCPILSCPILSCPILSCPVLSYPVLSCPVLSYPVLSCATLPIFALYYFLLYICYAVLCFVLSIADLSCLAFLFHFSFSSSYFDSFSSPPSLFFSPRRPLGSCRKVVVSTYVEEDQSDQCFAEITKHYIIYECNFANKKTLHRHFLMNNEGRIIELLDSLISKLFIQNSQIERTIATSNNHRELSGLLLDNSSILSQSQSQSQNDYSGLSRAHTCPGPSSSFQGRKKRIFFGMDCA
jgi:hypothetical protein